MKKFCIDFSFLFFSKILNFLNFAENSPHKLFFQQKMLSRSQFSSNHFVFRKISVSPAFSEFFLSSPSCIFFVVRKKSFLEKNLIRKILSLKKKLLSSPLDCCSFFLRAKTLFYFSFVLLLFAFVFFCFFFFFNSVFSGVFHLFWVFQTKKKKLLKKKSPFEKCVGFSKVFFWTFFEEGTYFWSKKECVQKNIIRIFLKKISLQKKKTYFKIHTRWRSRARSKALLTIAACRDVVERVKSMCIQWSLISAAGHPLHQAVSRCVFFNKKNLR